MSQESVNSYILNLGGIPEQDFIVYFRLHSVAANEKNIALSDTELSSNIAEGVFVPYIPDSDMDTYKYIYACGTFNQWKHSHPATQFLFNYTSDDNTYSGILDLGTGQIGFKLSGGPTWNKDNWGCTYVPEDESKTVQLSADNWLNIICYKKRFYLFSFDRNSLILTKELGFEQMGIIGLNGDWDNDIVMQYNLGYNRFYADVTAETGTDFKFRLDGAWDTSWGKKGQGIELGGDSIPVQAGIIVSTLMSIRWSIG